MGTLICVLSLPDENLLDSRRLPPRRDGEGSIAKEEAGDDDEDILGTVLARQGGDLQLGCEEGHGAADLVQAKADRAD